MKYSMVCCYLTHNHSSVLERVLKHSLKTYEEHAIDICVYDDSDDDETKSMVSRLIEEGAGNLYYVDVHEAEGGNHKMFLVMNGYKLPKEYDYIWPIKDRQCFESSFLDRLCEVVDENPDIIVGVNEWQRWDISRPVSKDIYRNPTEFYRDYGFYLTNWECTIRKRSTMLDPVDWDSYIRSYDIKDNPFNQLQSVFARAAEMKDFTAAVCRYDQNERYFSVSEPSSWKKIVFELWIDKWTNANFRLPDIYDTYKMKVIKDETNLREIFGSVSFFMNYRESGIYNRQVYEKYKNVWPMITDIPMISLEQIADGDYETVIAGTVEEFERAIKEQDHLSARYLLAGNSFMKEMFKEDDYNILFKCYNKYTFDLLEKGTSEVFEGLRSITEIVRKYKSQDN